ncbi:YARHG domain-containing protein [Psychroflexus sp. MES1-P1E]|uniref:YARHG domain-containing protein n=1 Tax=Psychroflexus sp. MES1-P1E TaxID=2058320 RepID=UPI000C796DF2|nr:YARHG domain-containing protein [Psychroflexus sp. MES1-P1E]PKG43540.1 hypothetical protein CXF67_04570 [Psychroflexus sp. MES1-P1E]
MNYSGNYIFGFSEGESELMLVIADSIVVAQVHTFYWQGEILKDSIFNFNNAKIEGSNFYCDETSGSFSSYNRPSEFHNGLLILNPWTYEFCSGGEYGSYIDELYVNGDYPEVSLTVIREQELQKLASKELKLMRNEIFARYGYMFREGGEMEAHFSSKKWYEPKCKNVDSFLTVIELLNIELIKKVEKKQLTPNKTH